MRPATFVSSSLVATFAHAQCTPALRKDGLQKLIDAFITGNETVIDQIPLTDNVTSIIQIQGARFILGRDREAAKRAIRLVNRITFDFGPAPYDPASYFDNDVDTAYINGTATVGPDIADFGLPLPLLDSLPLEEVIGVRSPATQNMVYDNTQCKAYEAVGTVDPVNGAVQKVLEALLLQNFPAEGLLDGLDELGLLDE